MCEILLTGTPLRRRSPTQPVKTFVYCLLCLWRDLLLEKNIYLCLETAKTLCYQLCAQTLKDKSNYVPREVKEICYYESSVLGAWPILVTKSHCISGSSGSNLILFFLHLCPKVPHPYGSAVLNCCNVRVQTLKNLLKWIEVRKKETSKKKLKKRETKNKETNNKPKIKKQTNKTPKTQIKKETTKVK